MRVKITKCSDYLWWYAGLVGDEFEVISEHEFIYKASAGSLLKTDCEIVQDIQQFTEESWNTFANAQEASKREQLLEDMKNFKEFLNQSEEERKAVDLLKGLGYEVKKVTASQESDDGWIPWSGGECPVTKTTIVEVKWKIGAIYCGEAWLYYWDHLDNACDIIAYRVVKTP